MDTFKKISFYKLPLKDPLDPIFGNDSMGTGPQGYLDGYIRGSLFTCPNDGTADSITICIATSFGTFNGNIKCAIYKHSDLSLVAVTEEKNISVSTTKTQFTFNFNAPKPSVVANTEYVLVAWAQTTATHVNIYCDTGTTNQFHQQTLTYNSFPSTLSPTHGSDKCCIYCTYSTVSAPTVTTQDATGIGRD